MSEIRIIVITDVPTSRCQLCLTEIDVATSFDGERPSPGDLSVCIDCGALHAFRSDFRLRLATDEDVVDQPECVRERVKLYQRICRERRKHNNAAESY